MPKIKQIKPLEAYGGVSDEGMRGMYHQRGIRTHLLPWGLVLNKGSPDDELGTQLQQQLETIRKKVGQ